MILLNLQLFTKVRTISFFHEFCLIIGLLGKSLDNVTTRQLYEDFGLDTNTQAFTGHAMALHRDDDYLNEPASATAEAIQLYVFSLERYGKSPYIYPLYGLGGMPEGFSRLCAIHGGTFMLNKGIDEILFDNNGKAWGVRGDNEVAKANIIVGDPSYFPSGKTRVAGRVVRSICILDHPVVGTDNAESVQIIIPATQVFRTRNFPVLCQFVFLFRLKDATIFMYAWSALPI
jgi:Rab GDP dissociation inhibitor